MVLYEPRSATANRSLEHLSKEDVAALLKSIELGAYADAFLATPITGADLKLMEEADLESLGVGVSIHRRRLLRQIEDWSRDGGVPFDALVHPSSNPHGDWGVRTAEAPFRLDASKLMSASKLASTAPTSGVVRVRPASAAAARRPPTPSSPPRAKAAWRVPGSASRSSLGESRPGSAAKLHGGRVSPGRIRGLTERPDAIGVVWGSAVGRGGRKPAGSAEAQRLEAELREAQARAASLHATVGTLEAEQRVLHQRHGAVARSRAALYDALAYDAAQPRSPPPPARSPVQNAAATSPAPSPSRKPRGNAMNVNIARRLEALEAAQRAADERAAAAESRAARAEAKAEEAAAASQGAALDGAAVAMEQQLAAAQEALGQLQAAAAAAAEREEKLARERDAALAAAAKAEAAEDENAALKAENAGLKEAAKKWEVAADAAEAAAEVAASELNAAVASAVAAAAAPAAVPEAAAEAKSGPPYVKVQIVRV